MKKFYVTFFSDIFGIVESNVLIFAKSLNALKTKIHFYVNNNLQNIDFVQVYNCTDDKLYEAPIKSLNFYKL